MDHRAAFQVVETTLSVIHPSLSNKELQQLTDSSMSISVLHPKIGLHVDR